jgi:DNA-binding response OmpR family regulator
MPQTVLVIEDDASIRRGLADALEFHGFRAQTASRGDEGLSLALKLNPDLVLLDLIMPGMLGLEVLESLREARAAMPVIILTAKGEEPDRVKGLKLGADDYVVKPFSVLELIARIQAVLRRSAERPEAIKTIRIPKGKIDLAKREIQFDSGKSAEISEKEHDLLAYLCGKPGIVVSRDEILLRVWGIDPQGADTRTIDMTIMRLREKMGAGEIIRTIRGKGYLYDKETVQ